jgi:3-oxoacyl-[acyl-carrier-protein] synthase-3
VIGAEALTRLLDFDDPKTAHLFGDGAGAVVLAPTAPGDRPIMLAADGSARAPRSPAPTRTA